MAQANKQQQGNAKRRALADDRLPEIGDKPEDRDNKRGHLEQQEYACITAFNILDDLVRRPLGAAKNIAEQP